MGKQHRSPFPQKVHGEQILQLVQADICGPISPISNNNKRYLLTFINYSSRKIWVLFLAEKSEAFECFKIFKVKVGKAMGTSFCGLRSNRGGEFTSKEFHMCCQTNEIQRKLTVAYTQQNIVA